MKTNECKHKVEGNQILYFNGLKWLVRETRPTEKEAQDKYKFLKEINNLKDA